MMSLGHMNKKVIISFLLIVKTFLFASGVCASQEQVAKKLTLEQSMQLLEDTKYLLSDKETIDYNDLRLNEILNKYADKYDLFKIYKAFIEFDKSKKTKDDIAKAKKMISTIHFNQVICCSDDILDRFFSLMVVRDISFDLKAVINAELPEDIRSHVSIPLWLVLKYPDILNCAFGRWGLGINASHSAENLSSFNSLSKHITEAAWNYWYYYKGSMTLDKLSSIYYMKSKISFAPSLLIQDNFSC